MTIQCVLAASLSTMLLALPATARAFVSCGSYSECERAYANQRARAIENEMMLEQMRKTSEQRAQARAASSKRGSNSGRRIRTSLAPRRLGKSSPTG